jgi:hypothetical protein
MSDDSLLYIQSSQLRLPPGDNPTPPPSGARSDS